MGLPFGWYHTFVIEERFGFNKTTPKTFWMDRIKALVLGLLIGVPVLVLVLWLLGKMGESAWLYVWGAITLISLALQYIAPTWIMPFFNTFKPLQANDPLRQAVLSYAHNVSFPLTNILVMDGSRRSSKANAFFTGFGKNRRIALFDTLIADHTIPELTAIVAHEVGHYKHRHLLKGMITGILQTGAYLFVLSLCIKLPGLYAAFGLEQQSVYAGLVFFGLLFSPIEFLLGMLSNYFSRKHEFEADAYALETAPEPEALGEALKKMSVKHLTNLNPHPLFVFLNHSHPPLLQRLAAMERILLVKP
ncbi:MAG TPA: M48 family metallopeptidase, partial [Rhodothermales bacterium]|nr:M48 family metallopeptidase [Rhodothermales bacterium]